MKKFGTISLLLCAFYGQAKDVIPVHCDYHCFRDAQIDNFGSELGGWSSMFSQDGYKKY